MKRAIKERLSVCKRCNEEFTRKSYNQKYCGSAFRKEGCSYRVAMEWGQKSGKKFSNRLKSRYGITLDDYELLLEEQNNRCAICRRDKKLNVDHCHNSLAVRGLLCYSCNSGLGLFADNIVLMKQAIEYLERDVS